MKTNPLRTLLILSLTLGIATAQTSPPSAPAAQTQSPIRGLSTQEVDDLLNGRGAGYARSAELNSYPGPAHALELRTQLKLSADQITRITAAQIRMKTAAIPIGKRIVDLEKALSLTFSSNTVKIDLMQQRTSELGGLYGQYRAIHLAAHLEVTPLLSLEQVRLYDMLRGYVNHNHPR